MSRTLSRACGGQPCAVGVVVPARDEARWLGRCLRALRGCVVPAGVRVHVVVVADACTDETAAVARSALADVDGAVLELGRGNVGVARATGLSWAVAGLGSRGTWLATTDADTVVRPDWLARQLEFAARGWHAVAGTVEVTDWGERGPATRAAFAAFQARRGTGDGHGHVHGANLGFSATAYLEAGGMPGLPAAEDHALWTALRATGRPVRSDGGLVVDTSARRSKRVPDGFSHLLDGLSAQREPRTWTSPSISRTS